jgi:Zn ribbon nucleic-acid-binding protein
MGSCIQCIKCLVLGHKWDKTWRFTDVEYLECLRCGYKFKPHEMRNENG